MIEKSPRFAHIQLEVGLGTAVSADELASLFNEIRYVIESRNQILYCNLTKVSERLKHDQT
jgi:hypothetical protein